MSARGNRRNYYEYLTYIEVSYYCGECFSTVLQGTHILMAYPPATSSWPSQSLPIAIPPIPPDFHVCHPFYGDTLTIELCVQAASRLPVGISVTQYGYPPHQLRHGYYNLPTEIKQESSKGDFCIVTIDSVFTAYSNLSPLPIVATPYFFRAAASWIIHQCVMPNYLGGFATVSLQSMIDWVANDSTTRQQLQDWAVPLQALFFTVTISGRGHVQSFPADYEPEVGLAIGDGVRKKGNAIRGTAIKGYSNILERSVNSVFTWWEVFKDRNRDLYRQPSTKSSSSFDMVYTCDADLGTPSTVDCAQLAYSSMPGAPSDTLVVSPGSGTKFISQNSCNVGITAEKTVVLTWAQVQAGVNALVNNCVLDPSIGVRGGRAYASSTVTTVGRKKKRIGAAPTQITGLNALPPGVNLTLFEQSLEAAKDPIREILTCTWTQALGTGRVDICPSGT